MDIIMVCLFLLIFLSYTINAQDDDYFEDLNPSRFKIFGPFRDPPIHLARTTTEVPSFDNETSTNSTKDEFILGETISSDNSLNPSSNSLPVAQSNNCQYFCQPVSPCQSCTCAAPKPVCIPRPVPICPPPPAPLLCPPPACPKPAACPPCLQIPTIPPPCICPTPPIQQPQNDCCCNCNQPCRTIHHRSKFLSTMHGAKTFEIEQNMSRCNSQQIRKLIAENISPNLEKSKHNIQVAAQAQIGKMVNIVCGHGEFSYIVQTQTYCQYSVGHTTCYVFESI